MGERADDMMPRDPDEIQSEIERTREDMGETIDEIQQRLSPQHLKEEATQQVREATVGRVEHAGESLKETGMSMWETVKQNPIPAALVGVGLGWLYMSRGESSSRREYPYGQTRLHSRYSTREFQEGAGQSAERAMHQAQEIGGQMRQRTEHMGEMAQDRAQQMRGQFGQMFEENPLAIGIVAFGVGAAVGLSIPESRKEHQLMGEKRDQLLDQAKETAQDTMQRAEHVAEQAFDEAKTTAEEEARQQGLTE